MNTLIRRSAPGLIRQPLVARRYASTTKAASERLSQGADLAKRARRDPELYPLWAIVGTTLAVAGWYLIRNPTSSNSENKVGRAEGTEPWNTGKNAKYEFHPHGDPTKPRKEAPSALNEVIVPNVTLPKHLHDKYNKWGKEGY